MSIFRTFDILIALNFTVSYDKKVSIALELYSVNLKNKATIDFYYSFMKEIFNKLTK